MGGEPTLYPYILPLIEYCNKINIRPTIITNGRRFSNIKYLENFVDHGLNDILLSICALEDTYDKIIPARKPDGWKMLLKCLENIARLRIPFRINTTMIRWNLKQLIDIVRLASEYGALVMNFITFNPYFKWHESQNIEFQTKHSVTASYLRDAIAACVDLNIEANVRYFPFCCLRGLEKYIYNNPQLPYDPHEWDFNSWFNRNILSPDFQFYADEAKLLAQRNGYRKGELCQSCKLINICDGFHGQYLERFGFSECSPYEGASVIDPTHFLINQRKLILL